jgi:hypothetical protein
MAAAKEPTTEEMSAVPARGTHRGRCPLENPAVAPIPGDPLREPHPDEPGVKPDGSAAPLENPI